MHLRDSQVRHHGPPATDPASWLGDGEIAARAVEVELYRFRLDIDSVVLTTAAPGVEELQISVWHAWTGDMDVVRSS